MNQINIKELRIEKDLSPIFSDRFSDEVLDSIFFTYPVLGVLDISYLITDGRRSPIPSIVNSILCESTFYYWENLKTHLNRYIKGMNNQTFPNIKKWENNLLDYSKDVENMLLTTVALFLQHQMQVLSRSPNPVQPIGLDIISASNLEKNKYNFGKPGVFEKTNAKLIVTLHGGLNPLVQVNHPVQTIRKWQNEIEAAVILLFPQIIDSAKESLNSINKNKLSLMINEEVIEWNKELPYIGQKTNWKWQPVFN